MKNKKLLSLYERVQFKQNIKANNSQYNYKFVGSNYTGLSVKETAKIIRKHLRQRFPEVKISVRSDYDSINVIIKASPYERESQELQAIFKYCEQLLDSYNFDDSDPLIDYFHVHFYPILQIAVDYTQTEQTEEIIKDIANFKQQLQQKQEKQIQQDKQTLTEEDKQKQLINNSITVKDLPNSEQYFIKKRG